jgi:hypothetical protein
MCSGTCAFRKVALIVTIYRLLELQQYKIKRSGSVTADGILLTCMDYFHIEDDCFLEYTADVSELRTAFIIRAMMMEVVRTSEMVHFNKTTRRYGPEGYLHFRR